MAELDSMDPRHLFEVVIPFAIGIAAFVLIMTQAGRNGPILQVMADCAAVFIIATMYLYWLSREGSMLSFALFGGFGAIILLGAGYPLLVSMYLVLVSAVVIVVFRTKPLPSVVVQSIVYMAYALWYPVALIPVLLDPALVHDTLVKSGTIEHADAYLAFFTPTSIVVYAVCILMAAGVGCMAAYYGFLRRIERHGHRYGPNYQPDDGVR